MASQPPDGNVRDPPYTGWHFFMVKLLEACADPAKLEVKGFAKLGDLPLEADAILLRKVAAGLSVFLYPDLAFLDALLLDYSVVEYKSPQDRLTWEDFDQGRSYALLCKRKFRLRLDRQVAVIFLASAVSDDFYEVAAQNGHAFGEADHGIRRCQQTGPGDASGITYYTVNLMELGKTYPESLLNLLSARRRLYQLPAISGEREVLARDLFYATLSEELRKMQDRYASMPGLREVTTDLTELRRQVMAMHTIEERLEGIPPEQRLEGIPPEQRLAGLTTEQRAELLKLLLKG